MVGVTFQLFLLSPLFCVTVGYPEFVTFTQLTLVSFAFPHRIGWYLFTVDVRVAVLALAAY